MLDGVRVLDLSRVIAGPYCTMLLADLGADVIKLERPGRGDDFRSIRGDSGMNGAFAAVNRNKRGIAVDLTRPEGARIGFELARRADVIVENFLPGVVDRLGLGYEAVRAVNPAVVYASISGFGQTGPCALRPGYNLIAQGMSGLMAITGRPDDPPTRPGGSIADVAASFLALATINAALVQRSRTGRGQFLDVSLLASTMALLPDPIAHYFENGVAPRRMGNRNPYLAPAEPFRARDGYVTVVLTNPEQWERFCAVLGDPDMASDTRFATNAARLAHRDAFVARVEARLASATSAEWVARFEAARIAAGPVYEFDEVFRDPQVRHLELVAEVDQPGHGPVKMLAFPVRALDGPPKIRRPAPRLGEHTREVLSELGFTAEAITVLAAADVIACAVR